MRSVKSEYVQTGTAQAATCDQVLMVTVGKIQAASRAGRGLRLSAAEVRSLDWSIIREEGGYSRDRWLDGSYAEAGEDSPP